MSVLTRFRSIRQLVGLCVLALVAPGGDASAQTDPSYESTFVDVGDARLHYLDFGGEGLPIVFTPALFLPVEEYTEIASRLEGDFHVFVVARRDEGGPVQWLGTRAHAEDLLGFLDALGIERAVLAGNTDPAYRMTYLAEEHPERVAGLVYLAGPPSAAAELLKDPISGGPMLMRLWGAGEGYVEEEVHPFRYQQDEGFRFSMPALTYVNLEGTRGVEEEPVPLEMLQDEAFREEQLPRIEDPEVRAYFERLAMDEAMQAEVARFYAERVAPVERENWRAFKRAFGERLQMVELETPVVTGYEYKAAPDLIEPDIRLFLERVRELEEEPGPVTSSTARAQAASQSWSGPVIDLHLHAGPGSAESRYYSVREAETEEQKRDTLYDNAARFLRPSAEEIARDPAAGSSTLGAIDFPTSGEPAAQAEFIQGVLALHSFWYPKAREHFQRAREMDAGFAMAYWGEAMTHDHAFWGEQDSIAARLVLGELDAAAAAMNSSLTEREQAYVDAVRALYATSGSVDDRRRAAAERLVEIAERWPDDEEARVFGTLYRMAERDWSPHEARDVASAAAVLEEVFAGNPSHPGAAHYLIHAYDSPEFAPLGLRAARAFADIAPASSHALHMPSHIFFELGMWDEGVRSNHDAWNASVAWTEREDLPLIERDYHALGWWIFALSQQGRFEEARRLIAQGDSLSSRVWSGEPPQHPLGAMLPFYLAMTKASYARDARAAGLTPDLTTRVDPDLAERIRAIAPQTAIVGAMFASRVVEGQEAEALAERLRAIYGEQSSPGDTPPPNLAMLEARIALAVGDTAAALEAYDRAVALADAAPTVMPHILGDVPREERAELLLAAGRGANALADYRAVLERAPRRPRAILGAARAALAVGRTTEAAAYYRELLDVWNHADAGLPAADEARRFLSRGGSPEAEPNRYLTVQASIEPRAGSGVPLLRW